MLVKEWANSTEATSTTPWYCFKKGEISICDGINIAIEWKPVLFGCGVEFDQNLLFWFQTGAVYLPSGNPTPSPLTKQIPTRREGKGSWEGVMVVSLSSPL